MVFHKCFKKIRITGKSNVKDECVVYMEMKTQLKIDLKNTEDRAKKCLIENQLKIVENYLSMKCAEKNKILVDGYLEEFDHSKGGFSQHGFWKLKSKLCQKKMDPPRPKLTVKGS